MVKQKVVDDGGLAEFNRIHTNMGNPRRIDYYHMAMSQRVEKNDFSFRPSQSKAVVPCTKIYLIMI